MESNNPKKHEDSEQRKKERQLLKVCKEGNVVELKKILQGNLKTSLNLDTKGDNGTTCLHEAAMHTCQFVEIVTLLLENGASVNIQDNDGNTPLHGAVLFHCIENIKQILKFNPDLSITNQENASAIDFARNIGDTEMESILTGKEVQVKKKSIRQGRRIAKSVKRKIDSFLPSTPIMSPSILKKRRRVTDKTQEDCNENTHSPLSKAHSVHFSDMPVQTPTKEIDFNEA